MKITSHSAVVCVAAAALLGVAGCVTSSTSKMASSKNADLAYWTACMDGNKAARSAAARSIAEREFIQRRKAVGGDTLHELKAYLKTLTQPVSADTTLAGAGAELAKLTAAETSKLRDYIRDHSSEGLFDGAEYSASWAREIERIRSMMVPLKAKLDKVESDARAKLGAKDIDGAKSALDEAQKIDRDGETVLELEKDILSAQAAMGADTFKASLRDNFLKKAGTLCKAFGSADSKDPAVSNCVSILGQAEDAITLYRSVLKTSDGASFRSPEVDRALEDVEGEIASLRGSCWSEQIRLLAGRKQYWEAHQCAVARFNAAESLRPHQKAAESEPITGAYGRMLRPGVAQCVNDANRNFAQDAYGISLVLCRMAEEMLQCARSKGIRMDAETSTWAQRCAESRADAQKRIENSFQRRILISEFSPAGKENERLTAMVMDRCGQALADSSTNRALVALGVVVERGADKSRPADCLIECNIPELTIVELPPVETERAVLKIGRDVTETPNPFYHPEFNKHAQKTVFSQEVFVFQSARKKYEKKARLTLTVTATLNGRKRTLRSLDTEFSGDRNPLEGVVLAGSSTDLAVPFLGTPRTAASRKLLPQDPWPKSEAAILSSEAEIDRAVRNYAMNAISDSIISLASSYPVEILAADAVRHAAAGNRYEAANSWGQCLEYCTRLYCGENGEPDWNSLKTAMAGRIKELETGLWKDCDGKVTARMGNLWNEAVSSVLAVQAN